MSPFWCQLFISIAAFGQYFRKKSDVSICFEMRLVLFLARGTSYLPGALCTSKGRRHCINFSCASRIYWFVPGSSICCKSDFSGQRNFSPELDSSSFRYCRSRLCHCGARFSFRMPDFYRLAQATAAISEKAWQPRRACCGSPLAMSMTVSGHCRRSLPVMRHRACSSRPAPSPRLVRKIMPAESHDHQTSFDLRMCCLLP